MRAPHGYAVQVVQEGRSRQFGAVPGAVLAYWAGCKPRHARPYILTLPSGAG